MMLSSAYMSVSLDSRPPHNSPPKPYFLFLLGKRGFGRKRLGMLLMRSHVRESFQLTETRS